MPVFRQKPEFRPWQFIFRPYVSVFCVQIDFFLIVFRPTHVFLLATLIIFPSSTNVRQLYPTTCHTCMYMYITQTIFGKTFIVFSSLPSPPPHHPPPQVFWSFLWHGIRLHSASPCVPPPHKEWGQASMVSRRNSLRLHHNRCCQFYISVPGLKETVEKLNLKPMYSQNS